MENTETSLRFRMSRWVMAHRKLVGAIFAAITIFFAVGIRYVELKTIFSDLLPKDDPFVQVFKDHPNFGNPLTITLMIKRKDGDIYNAETLAKVWKLTRDIDLSPGVDHDQILSIATEPWFIPDTTKVKDQLNAFLKRRIHFALIVDEYGALMGLVTLEDILEEIVGEIEDEHDFAVEGVRRQPDGSVNVDGSVTIRDLNRALDWSLPDDEWVTVAGLVIHEAQTIPDPGQTFIFHGHRFQVLRRQRNQVTALRVSPPLEEGAV